MRILTLELVNIKIYDKLELNFDDGVTAIVGSNGSGKSTILESISYMLFNEIPYSQKEFVKEGHQSGYIELSMDTGNYYITMRRGVGKGQYIEMDVMDITSAPTNEDETVTYNSIKEVYDFLQEEVFGVEIPIELLSRELIAIPQGFLVTRFLDTPTQRKNIFDKVMGVEEWKELSIYIREIAHLGEIRYNNMENDYAKADGEITTLERIVGELPEKEKVLDDLSNEIERIQVESNRIQDNLDKSKALVQQSQDLEKAEQSRSIMVEQTKADQSKYDAMRLQLKELGITDSDISIKTKIMSKYSENTKILMEFADADKKLQRMNEQWEKLISIQKEIPNLVMTLTQNEKIMKDGERLKMNIRELEEKITENETRDKELRLDKDIVDDGLCPILGESCERVSSEALDVKLEKLMQDHEELVQKRNKMQLKLNESGYIDAKTDFYAIKARLEEWDNIDEMVESAKLEKEKATEENESRLQFLSKQRSLEAEIARLDEDAISKYEQLKASCIALEDKMQEDSAQITTLNEFIDWMKEKLANFDKEQYEESKSKLQYYKGQLESLSKAIESQAIEVEKIRKDSDVLKHLKDTIGELGRKIGWHKEEVNKLQSLRKVIKDVNPLITDAYLDEINLRATVYGRQIFGEGVGISVDGDYNIYLSDSNGVRPIKVLSGGEKVGCALSVRLAMAEWLSPINIGFLDEPTIHLDGDNRKRLAEFIAGISGIDQLIVVSHDDTFEDIVEHYIRIENGEVID